MIRRPPISTRPAPRFPYRTPVRSAGIANTCALGPSAVLRPTADLLAAGLDSGPEADTDLADSESPAVLLFTSGTTGTPKIAILRHRHLFSYVTSTVEFGHAGPEEAIMVSVPNYHIAGISSEIGRAHV